jgi:hypothetical protein
MSVKKTVSLQDYVLKAAEPKVKKLFGGSLSNYLSYLICNDNKEEIEECLLEIELSKPLRISEAKTSLFESECPYCHKKIRTGEAIYNVILSNGLERYVHEDCSRDEGGTLKD